MSGGFVYLGTPGSGTPSELTGTAMFPDKVAALAKLRRVFAFGPGASLGLALDALDDDDLWEKLVAAEAWIAMTLRVPLTPTRFFAVDPTQEQIDALNGAPWSVDTPYDYDPGDYLGNHWGMLLLRNKPVIGIRSVRFAYPSTFQTIMDIPSDWVRVDRRAGSVQFVPTSSLSLAGIGGMMLTFMQPGRTIPFVVQIEYDAGLQESSGLYPIIRDVILKRTMVLLLEDSFLPQSGSISGDGLSQSMSVEAAKYHEAVDSALHGTDSGGNGGLMARIHGIRLMVC